MGYLAIAFLLGSLLFATLAAGEFVDGKGAPVFPRENYRQQEGSAAFRDANGKIHYQYIRPSDPAPPSTPSLAPSHTQPREDRYEFLRDRTPDTGSSFRDNSIFHDRK